MKNSEFQKRLVENPKPLIVDIWAPWCGPCRAMDPVFKQVSQKYIGQMDVLKVNTDESPEVLKSLGVLGIPTVVGFAHGKEILRRTGIQPVEVLEILFDSALHQRKPIIIPLTQVDRLFRSVAGLALLISGWIFGHSLVLLGIGGWLIFSAFYNLCPIYRAIVSRLAALFSCSQ